MNLGLTITETVTVQPTFGEMLEKLFVEKHTGPVIFHFAQGRPNTMEIPSEPLRIVLDKRKK